MNCLPLTFFYLSVLLRFVLCLSPTYLECQLLKSAGKSALTDCPNGTLYVSQTDLSANFSSVQEAIDSLPRTGRHAHILIGQGDYFESVNVTRAARLTLLGQLDPATASIRAGNASQRNIVRIWNSKCALDGLTDEETATLTVAPSSGYSFGNVDFRAYNIDFENRAANYSIAQALAASLVLTNASFYGCTFSSYQDTWYSGYGANTYVVDSIIYGETDYLFGFGRAWFQSVTLANRGCGGAITAWSGTPGTTNGVYITHSRIIRSPDADPTVVTDKACYLGRPWNDYSRAIYIYNYMDGIINTARFTSWYAGGTIPSTANYAEFKSHGPGGSMSPRVELSEEQAQVYTLGYVFGETPHWIDGKYRY